MVGAIEYLIDRVKPEFELKLIGSLMWQGEDIGDIGTIIVDGQKVICVKESRTKAIMVNVADLPNPENKGKTWRESNAELEHSYPVGTLVELENGARLFVVHHSRDCDQTPLYCLSHDKDDTEQAHQGFGNRGWTCGYAEEFLTPAWVDINSEKPEEGQLVIAHGTYEGELDGWEGSHVGVGIWKGSHVELRSDGYSAWIVDVTHWHPAPEAP